MNTTRIVALDERIADNDDRLFQRITQEFGDSFSASRCDISKFEPFLIQLFHSQVEDRIVIFRHRPSKTLLGCIRVLEGDENQKKQDDKKQGTETTVWEIMEAKGVYAGLIPAGCRFEAMYVELRLITKR
ncbi:Uncharacterized protein TPAR_07591 [Tolypocladium paradoxum]|uniref:Uncharacterized protein n=1 Tax=Tolypocladium paradoxum TaxID=94208 RepID=A0A2S4KPV6_9HYPO|nr:Uncharacterized protein TPAR_07591 [Tolypocladium paradoxum]